MRQDVVVCEASSSAPVGEAQATPATSPLAPIAGATALPAPTPSGMPMATVAELDEIADSLAETAEPINTIRSYTSDWHSWLSFCERHGFQSLPADPVHVRRYLAQLGRVGGRKVKRVKPRTVERHLAAIMAAHRGSGLVFNTKDPNLELALRGLRRSDGTPQEGARALRAKDIVAICKTLGDFDVRSRRDKAVILLGFAGAFRRSELVGLNVSDLAFEKDGFLRVTLQRSKTDQIGKGRVIAIAPGTNPETCPIAALRAWLKTADIEHEGENALFRPINRWGTVELNRLSDKTVDRIVKSAARAAALKDSYSAHSLRAGHVTEALAQGADRAAIKRQTGHRSDAMLDRYARETNLAANNSSSKVGL